MFGGALIAIGTLLSHLGGLGEVVRAVPQLTTHEGYFLHGFETSVVAKWKENHQLAAMGPWDSIKLILASDYTLFSALLGATLGNMAAFGTDQDMVQRMLTAETHQRARRSLVTAAFLRSEEHTSELQSRLHLVCRLLLEKKKTKHTMAVHTE